MQDVSVAVSPSSVKRGGEITVTVSSGEPVGDWLLRVCESGGVVKSRPTRLSVYGAPASDGGSAAVKCKIRTIGYEPGEYMVDVSPDDTFGPGRTVTRRLVVEPTSRSGAWYLMPIFLGLLGGIIAYLAVRHDDPSLARNCLIVAVVVTVLLFLPLLLLPLGFAHPPALAP